MKAKFTLAVSPTDDGLFVGHAWIIIKNIGEEPFLVGDYLLEESKTLTMGKFMGLPIGHHKEDGVYYNLECIEQNKYHRLKRNIAISKIIHDKEIEKIQGYLLNCKCDTYDLTQDNCCHFAIGFFNAVIDELNLTMYTAPVMLFNHLLVAKLPKGFKRYKRIKLPKDMLSRRFKFDTGVINEDILNDLCDNRDSDNHILELGDEK
ncbi:MAG: hypothetical protein MJ232_07705 [archaeon]|nr:hypothetical protein [archaeon]